MKNQAATWMRCTGTGLQPGESPAFKVGDTVELPSGRQALVVGVLPAFRRECQYLDDGEHVELHVNRLRLLKLGPVRRWRDYGMPG